MKNFDLSRRALLLSALAVAVAAVALVAWIAPRRDAPAADPPPAPSPSAAGGLAAHDLDGDGIVYQSGMHPWIVQDEPGQCPVCGMDLTPTPVSGVRDGTIEIDPITVQNIGVRTALVEVAPLERSVRTTGIFTADERAREVLTLRVSGFVERLFVRSEGERVQKGQPVLALYSPELVATQEELLLALRSRALLGAADGDRLVEAARTRLRLFGITDAQIERLEQSGTAERTLTIYAPAGGTIVRHNVIEGQQATAGAPLMEIASLGQLWLQIDVPEAEIGWVQDGARAIITLPGEPGVERAGRVSFVYDRLDTSTRTGTARVVVSNPGLRIKPGMFATAVLYGGAAAPAPVVPVEAVLHTGDRAAVVLALGEGRFKPQSVTLGAESEGRVQVIEGLSGGERIVTSAQFLLDSEARLSQALASLAPAPETALPDAHPLDHDH